MTAIRPPAVAGTFYPADPVALRQQIAGFLAEADNAPPVRDTPPKAIIGPHAGYIYSGGIAARAYARLAGARGRIGRVVLIGPSHYVAFQGLAVDDAQAWATPGGTVHLDIEAITRLRQLPMVGTLEAAYAREHALEVHVPFLTQVLGSFKLVPIVAGNASAEQVAAVLDAVWGGPETLIVVSTDLSHYLDYDACRRMDAGTAAAIERFDLDAIEPSGACGAVPTRGLLLAARRRGMSIERLDLRNSGDTAGPRDRVVGYGAWALHPPELPAAAPGAGVHGPAVHGPAPGSAVPGSRTARSAAPASRARGSAAPRSAARGSAVPETTARASMAPASTASDPSAPESAASAPARAQERRRQSRPRQRAATGPASDKPAPPGRAAQGLAYPEPADPGPGIPAPTISGAAISGAVILQPTTLKPAPAAPASRGRTPERRTPERHGQETAVDEETAAVQALGPALLQLVRTSIALGFDTGRPADINQTAQIPPRLAEPGAAFVTLRRNGLLRGCIGSAMATRPLIVDVVQHAFNAAFRDWRFPKLAPQEWAGLQLSVAVLTEPTPMACNDEADLLTLLRPGTDGLIIEDAGRAALFLPSVWEEVPEPREFLSLLKLKAGMTAAHLSPAFAARRFQSIEVRGPMVDLPTPGVSPPPPDRLHWSPFAARR